MLTFLKKIEKLYKVAIILVDLLLINIAYILAFLIKFNGDLPDFNFRSYVAAAPFITIAALFYFDFFKLHKFYRKNFHEIAVSIFKVVFILFVTTVTITYFLQGFSFPRSVLLMSAAIQLVLLSIWKGLILWVKKLFSQDLKLMIIAERDELGAIIEKVEYTLRRANMHIKYIIPADEIKKAFNRLKDVDEVFISDNLSGEDKMKIIAQCIADRKVVYIVPKLFEISLMKARMVQFEDIPAFMIDKLELTFEQKLMKRVFDIAVSVLVLIITLPVTITAFLLVKLTSPGPAIFKQTRMTVKNRQFEIYKFRTMYVEAENDTGPVIASENDPRVTKIGKILRDLRIDELPQFINVLKGDMSIVGPRPERPFFVEQFSRDIPEYSHRYLVKAGITGYAQLLGKYDTSPEDKLRYDLLYIKDYNLLLDLKLILETVRMTVRTVLGKYKLFSQAHNQVNANHAHNNQVHSKKIHNN